MKTIRSSTRDDIRRLMEIYREGRQTMLDCGDLHQWAEGYPTEEMILADIDRGVSHAVVEDGEIVGAFAFIPGEDPTYGTVYDGAWLDSTAPYCTIHRLASTRTSHGVAEACFDWCWEQMPSLRVDTHEDNVIMRHCIARAGFTYCGIIHLLNGAPRLAYQKIQPSR